MSSFYSYPDLAFVRRVLVIKLRHLGDVLLSTPVFTLLKKRFPEVDGYIYEEGRPLLEGIADDIFSPHRMHEAKLLWEIRKKKYDLIFNLTEGDRGALAVLASKAKIRVGFHPGKKGLFGKRFFYTHLVKSCPTPRHMVERNLDALRKIGLFPEEKNLHFFISDKARESVLKLTRGYILIHPISRWRFKSLQPWQYRKLIQKLSEKKEVIVSVGPDPKEKEQVQKIFEGLDVKIFSLPLQEFGALIERSSLLITVDSLALHMASALKHPCLALFGPTSSDTWGPWQNPYAEVCSAKLSCQPCLQDGCGGSKTAECLSILSPERIAEQALRMSSIAYKSTN